MKPDTWIKKRVLDDHTITPFISQSIKREHDRKVLSYGLSCAGYDLRLTNKIYRLKGAPTSVDPKNTSIDNYEPYTVRCDDKGNQFIELDPRSISLASTIEKIKMPRDATAFVLPKSSYARCGIDVLNPLIEPEWVGNVTLAICNNTDQRVRLYINEGFCQLVFFGVEGDVETSYEDRGGKYQNSEGVVVSRM